MSIPPNGILKPEWELTDKERIELVSLWIKTNFASDKDAIDLVDMVQKAAQKKLFEWIEKQLAPHYVSTLKAGEFEHSGNWILLEEHLKALRKEMGVK